MVLRPAFLLALLAASPPAAAQSPAARSGWYLGGGVDVLRFGQVAVSAAEPGAAAELRPSSRAAFHLGAGRTLGDWSIGAELGLAEGHIEARNDVIAIGDLTADVSRYRVAIAVRRALAGVGAGALGLELAPAVDLWTVDGESRVRAGAEGRLVLRVPLGSWELENRLGFGLSGSPIETADIGAVSDERGLRTLTVGVGLRTGL